MKKRYDIIELTADTGIIAYGKTLEEMFSNASIALFDTMLNLEQIDDIIPRYIKLHADSLEDLFITWLKELLYIFSVENIAFKHFDFRIITDSNLYAKAYGDLFDAKTHEQRIEVKAITYHRLRVEYVEDHWEGEVIFDV